MNRMTTAIKSAKQHSANVSDHCEAISRLTTNIRDSHFKSQFQLVLTSLKKECDLVEAKVKKQRKREKM